MHQPERVVERADLSDGGCATPGLHFVCILGKRHALHICAESAVIGHEIGPCLHDRCAKATKRT